MQGILLGTVGWPQAVGARQFGRWRRIGRRWAGDFDDSDFGSRRRTGPDHVAWPAFVHSGVLFFDATNPQRRTASIQNNKQARLSSTNHLEFIMERKTTYLLLLLLLLDKRHCSTNVVTMLTSQLID